MTKKTIPKPTWKDYEDHWDYVRFDGKVIARTRIDGPPNEVYKDGIYVTTHYWGTHYIEFVDSTDLSLNKEMVEIDYEEYLTHWEPK